MRMKDLSGKLAIAGFGDAYTGKGEKKHPMQLASEAVAAALKDSHLKKDDIRGLLTGRAPVADQRPQWNNILSAYLKITPIFTTEVTMHAGGIVGMIQHAALALNAGLVDYVLCVESDSVQFIDPIEFVASIDADPQYERPFAPSIPTLTAMVARRHMHEYGTTEVQLAKFAVCAQNWGIHHPYATRRRYGPITVEDVLKSKMIASPLRLWNMAVWGPDGAGGAFVVTTAERAEALTDKPLYILGFGGSSTHEYLTDRMALTESYLPLGKLPNLTTTGNKVAGKIAFEMAGLRPADIDVVEASAQFAHFAMVELEDLGFCEKGGSGPFVEAGHIDVGGDLPFNTNGGYLSWGQLGMYGPMGTIVECIRQLRGEALGLQVKNPEIGLVQAGGGPFACNNVAILSTKKA